MILKWFLIEVNKNYSKAVVEEPRLTVSDSTESRRTTDDGLFFEELLETNARTWWHVTDGTCKWEHHTNATQMDAQQTIEKIHNRFNAQND